ncbi:LOW QUALITY PROTEIN: hypothetical protein MAR_036208 [Mya arenaria]|uniref:Uncharacterized protein n=1 Tax=Mya arenaria TaxID=6604 RepID=A0ABY7EPX4_MYAAR|nr:LOW QUALITY PROTEIN: hypothetical protein MAR_036208 [Mya arenaria]
MLLRQRSSIHSGFVKSLEPLNHRRREWCCRHTGIAWQDWANPAHILAVDGTIQIRNSRTVTQEPAYWLLPTSL